MIFSFSKIIVLIFTISSIYCGKVFSQTRPILSQFFQENLMCEDKKYTHEELDRAATKVCFQKIQGLRQDLIFRNTHFDKQMRPKFLEDLEGYGANPLIKWPLQPMNEHQTSTSYHFALIKSDPGRSICLAVGAVVEIDGIVASFCKVIERSDRHSRHNQNQNRHPTLRRTRRKNNLLLN